MQSTKVVTLANIESRDQTVFNVSSRRHTLLRDDKISDSFISQAVADELNVAKMMQSADKREERNIVRKGENVSPLAFFFRVMNSINNKILDRSNLKASADNNLNVAIITAGNHVTQQQQQWPIFEKNPWLQVRKSSIIPLIHDRLEFGLKQRRRKDSRDLLDVLDFLNNTW